MRWSILSRKLHRWGAILVALPILVMIGTGLLLHFKKPVDWIQPPEQMGRGGDPSISFAQILDICRGVPEAEIRSWDDVDRVDVRPDLGMLKVRSRSRWEIQIDTSTGEVLQTAYRRSDFIENIHDGSILGPFGKWAVFLPAALLLLGLWITGLYLWILPWLARRARKTG